MFDRRFASAYQEEILRNSETTTSSSDKAQGERFRNLVARLSAPWRRPRAAESRTDHAIGDTNLLPEGQ